ncbi:hypothetical protein L208DRAFT_1371956 [Tricholoma matsutake]|nr:hypothetical protein L208DRAFT_1371956 [Tricholoma matsutake 945]
MLRALKAQCTRAPRILKRAVHKASRRPNVIKLTKHGVFTPEARALARIIVRSGCSQAKVGGVIQSIGKLLGITIKTPMSHQTVGRAILEGGVAAKIQLGYEMSRTKSLTISADSTSHRKINYEARHVALRTPDYRSSDLTVDLNSTPSVHLLGVDSEVDHTSEVSVAGWLDKMEDVAVTFNKSPLSQRMECEFTMSDLADLLRGMNGDHASNEKRTATLMKEWKTEQTFIRLGSKQLARKTPADLIIFLAGWNQKKIEAVGGIDAWNALTPMEQTLRDVALVKELQIALGKEVYNQLPGDEKRIIDLFIWAGCCMHKDQNSFQGGNTEMMEQWEKSGYTPPLLLANKQNAAILRGILDPAKANAPLGEAETTALTASTRGGAKTCTIAGACLNNKDDKKGQGEIRSGNL